MRVAMDGMRGGELTAAATLDAQLDSAFLLRPSFIPGYRLSVSMCAWADKCLKCCEIPLCVKQQTECQTVSAGEESHEDKEGERQTADSDRILFACK